MKEAKRHSEKENSIESELASRAHKLEAGQPSRAHAQKGLVFGLMLCCCHLEILNNVLTKSSTFLFCTGPSKYIAGPAGDLKQQAECGALQGVP